MALSAPTTATSCPSIGSCICNSYRATLTVAGIRYQLTPGSVSLVPPGSLMRYEYEGPSEHLFAHLKLARSGPAQLVPVVQQAGAEVPLLSDLLRHAVTAAAGVPARAAAEVWTVLWRVAGLGSAAAGDRPHAAVAAALAYIEANLGAPLTVPAVARIADVSPTHLARLFRAQTGETVVGYLRRRRLHRARHLLRETTLPISTVAASVGIGDLQAFNKACHRELGAAPRAIRAGR